MPSSARVSAGGICSFLAGRSVNVPRDDVGIVPYDGGGCLFSVEIDAIYFCLCFRNAKNSTGSELPVD